MAKYRCRICHYVYNEKIEGIFFDDLFPNAGHRTGFYVTTVVGMAFLYFAY